MTLAVVGLEPEGSSLSACCFSNQRLHLPKDCPKPTEDLAHADPPADRAVSLDLQPKCQRSPQGTTCEGVIALTGPDATDLPITLSSAKAASFTAAGADCTVFAAEWAQCWLPVGLPLPFTLALPPSAQGGEVTLCAQIGMVSDGTARTLALQSALDHAGYPVGRIDGDFGPATQKALAAFAADAGLAPFTDQIPPEVLTLLGLGPLSDRNPANDRACTTATVSAPVLACDRASTRLRGDHCSCRFKGMKQSSATTCSCPKGQRLGKSGCIRPVDVTESNKNDPNPTPPACDPVTTVLSNGKCQCRMAGMVQISATACLPLVADPAPSGGACLKRNDVGECCDLLPIGDASCR